MVLIFFVRIGIYLRIFVPIFIKHENEESWAKFANWMAWRNRYSRNSPNWDCTNVINNYIELGQTVDNK